MYSACGLCQETTGSKRSSSCDVRVDGVEPDRVPELAQPGDRGDAFARGEVVEDRLGHQEVRRADVVLGLELGHPERGVEREVDVVAEEEIAALGCGRRSVVKR